MIKKMPGKIVFCFLCLCFVACTRVVSYGVDHHTPVRVHTYSTNLKTVMEKAQKALESLGYAIHRVDEYGYRIETGWKPVTSDSHYLDLFKRRDYSASTGSYYQVIIEAVSEGLNVKVSASTVVKSMSGRLSSSHVVENRILSRLDDYLRSPQIEMTNVGVKER